MKNTLAACIERDLEFRKLFEDRGQEALPFIEGLYGSNWKSWGKLVAKSSPSETKKSLEILRADLLKSKIARKAYYHPRGIVGDYRLRKQILTRQPSGQSLQEIAADRAALNSSIAETLRELNDALKNLLAREYAQSLDDLRVLRILSVGCLDCREFFDFLEETDAERFSFVGIDKDAAALEEAFFSQPRKSSLDIKLLQTDLLHWIFSKEESPFSGFSFIYTPGLSLFFSDKLLKRLLKKMSSVLVYDGKICLPSLVESPTDETLLSKLLGLNLTFRTEEAMDRLAEGTDLVYAGSLEAKSSLFRLSFYAKS